MIHYGFFYSVVKGLISLSVVQGQLKTADYKQI